MLSLVERLQKENPTPSPATSPLAGGTWRLLWSQQAENASPLQRWGAQQAESYQVGATYMVGATYIDCQSKR